jgi:hypothetical protein
MTWAKRLSRQLSFPFLDRRDPGHRRVGDQHQGTVPALGLLFGQTHEGLLLGEVKPPDEAAQGRVGTIRGQGRPRQGDVGDVHVVGQDHAVAIHDQPTRRANPESDLTILESLGFVVAVARHHHHEEVDAQHEEGGHHHHPKQSFANQEIAARHLSPPA